MLPKGIQTAYRARLHTETLITFTARCIKHAAQIGGPISRTGVCSDETTMLDRPAPWGATIREAVANSFSCDMIDPIPKNSTMSNVGNSSFRASRTFVGRNAAAVETQRRVCSNHRRYRKHARPCFSAIKKSYVDVAIRLLWDSTLPKPLRREIREGMILRLVFRCRLAVF